MDIPGRLCSVCFKVHPELSFKSDGTAESSSVWGFLPFPGPVSPGWFRGPDPLTGLSLQRDGRPVPVTWASGPSGVPPSSVHFAPSLSLCSSKCLRQSSLWALGSGIRGFLLPLGARGLPSPHRNPRTGRRRALPGPSPVTSPVLRGHFVPFLFKANSWKERR